MAVWTEDHFTACCKHFSCKLMDNRLMGRYIYAAIFLGTGKSKHMIIFINSSAYGTEWIMAVCQYIWHRKFLKAWSTCSLDNSDKSDIMRSQFIKFNLKFLHISGSIVCFQNWIGNCTLCSFLFGNRKICLILRNNLLTIQQIHTGIV